MVVKVYDGYFTPGRNRGTVTVEYACPSCRSGDVERHGEQFWDFVDGGPGDSDAYSGWRCTACGHIGKGEAFMRHRSSKVTGRHESAMEDRPARVRDTED